MKTSVCKEWHRADAKKGYSESSSNESHRDATRSRSRSPERWRGRTSGELARMVGTKRQTMQELSNAPYSGAADMIGPWTYHNATDVHVTKQSTRRSRDPRLAAAPHAPLAQHETAIIEPAISVPSNQKEVSNAQTDGHVTKQSTRRSRDPRLASIQPVQQETTMIQPAVSVLSCQPISTLKIAIDHSGVAQLLSHSMADQQEVVLMQQEAYSGQPIHTFKVATDPSDGHQVILSHSVGTIGHAAFNSVVDPSESSKGQSSRGSDVKARKTQDNDNQTKGQKMFKTALIEFVTKQIEKTRDQDNSTKELRDFITQKAVDNIMQSEKYIPSTKEKIRKYLRLSRRKIQKLTQAYFHKYRR